MKLDLLYEIDAPKPWPSRTPTASAQAEQRAYREAIEQIKLGDSSASTPSGTSSTTSARAASHCPAPEAVLGALSQITEQIRLGFGVTLPHGFGPAHARRREGGHRRHPLQRPGRVGHRPFDADGADRLRCRPRDSQGPGARGHRGHRRHVAVGVLRVRRHVSRLPQADGDPQARAGSRTRRPGWPPPRAARPVAGEMGSDFSPSPSCNRSRPWPGQSRQYREAGSRATPITRVTTNRVAAYTLVHCADTMAQAEANGIWDSVWWWYQNLAEFTLEWELPHLPRRSRTTFPLMKRHRRDFDPHEFSDADMIIVGDPEQCHQKMLRYADPRRRPADLLRAVRPLAARVGHADHRAAGHGSSPSSAGARSRSRPRRSAAEPQRGGAGGAGGPAPITSEVHRGWDPSGQPHRRLISDRRK